MGATTVPPFLARSARAATTAENAGNERVLVVVQLLGGNDGLNTVVPHGMDGYAPRPSRAPAAIWADPQDHRRHRPPPPDGPDVRAARERPAGDRAGGRLPEPRPLALPLDGDLGNRPDREQPGGTRNRLARPRARCPPAAPGADLPALHIGGAGPAGIEGEVRPRCPRWRAWNSIRLQLAGDDATRRSTRQAIGDVAEPRPVDR